MTANDDHASTTAISDVPAATPAPPRRRARRSWFGIRRRRAAGLLHAWRFAETEATLALTAWRIASAGMKDEAYAVYLAAVDRESKAADQLALRVSPSAA
jgi:hypothetical protein